jgi:hypothetical protein
MEMQKFCVVLILALGAAFSVPSDPAEASHTSKPRVTKVVKKHAGSAKSSAGRSVSLAGVTPVLVAKAHEIMANCGSTVVSAISSRPNRSNHPIGRAVDMVGNPTCIYAHLKGWPGGYSTDYSAVRHVHISYNPNGQEWGLRFAHNSPRPGRTHYARAHGSRIQSAAAVPSGNLH